MSIWRSPVLYFGILLVLLVISALAAPVVVPWNNYRSDLESYGEKLTGRKVSITGDIAVRLFPWPQLEAREIAIGNPTGFPDGDFVKADSLRVRLALGGLFSGRLDVESVEAVSPQINLQRNAAGEVNWIFNPRESVAGRGLLARVKLDQITLKNGIVSYDDIKNGHSALFSGLDAALSAQSIHGPWRMRGQTKWRDVPFDLFVTTNIKEPGKPLTFTTKFVPQDSTYPMSTVEGAWDGTDFKGALRIDPQLPTGGKASAEGALKPLAVQAKIEASTGRVSLLKLRISPADKKDSGTLIEGDVVVELGRDSRAVVDLRSPRINLDTLLSPSALSHWQSGGMLALANRVLAATPSQFVLDYKLGVNILTSGGQALNSVRLAGSLQREAIRVHEFAAEFPGRSSGTFNGILFPSDQSAQLGGKFSFDSGDTRAFLSWLTPAWREALEKHWTGSRGRLQVDSGIVDWTEGSFALSKVSFRFQGAEGRASVTSQTGANAALTVDVEADRLDIDSLAPNGWSVFRDGGLPNLVASLVQRVQEPSQRRRFVLKSGSLLLNGVTANTAALDFETSADGLTIKSFDIGNVGGARLRGGGALMDKGDGPEGDITFSLAADEPRAFLRLIGADVADARWTQSLGQTSLEAKIRSIPQKSGPEILVLAKGTSGAFEIEVDARAHELDKGQSAALSAGGVLKSRDSAALARLVGFDTDSARGESDIAFKANGSLAEGFAVSATARGVKAVARFDGTARLLEPFYGVSGRFDVRADDGADLIAAVGLPLPQSYAQPFSLDGLLSVKDRSLSFLDLVGHVAGRRVAGSATLGLNNELQADLETDSLDAKEVLALAFLPWGTASPSLEQNFGDVPKSGISGAVYLRPLQFDPLSATSQKEVVAAIGFNAEGRVLNIKSPGEQGIRADVALRPKSATYGIEGSLRWPVDVSRVFVTEDGSTLANGALILQGEFKTNGTSPAAMLAAVTGKGNFWLANAALPRMTLSNLAQEVLAASSSEELTAALARLNANPGTKLGQSIGNVEVNNGNMTLSELSPTIDGLDVKIAPQMDLAAGQIKLVTTIAIKNRPDLPPLGLSYLGEPGALSVRSGTAGLAAKLGYDLLAKEMAELERLQQEQQALLVKEEEQRRADEKRFAEYQSTRAELREQARIRRFHAGEREKQSAALAAIAESALLKGDASARIELQRHARRLEIHSAPPPPVP